MASQSPISQSPLSHRPAGRGPRHAPWAGGLKALAVGALTMGALTGAALLGAPILLSSAHAQAIPAQNPAGTAGTEGEAAGPRFAFAPVEGGALKLDRQTGKVSLCAKGPSGFTCEAVPDSRDAYEAEIARLQQEIATLKGGAAPNAGTGTTPGATTELDQALDYAERIYRRFKSIIDDLQGSGGQNNI